MSKWRSIKKGGLNLPRGPKEASERNHLTWILKAEKEGICQVKSEWKDTPGEATKGTGGLRGSAVLEEMEVWLEWRGKEGEMRKKAMLTVYPPPSLGQDTPNQ